MRWLPLRKDGKGSRNPEPFVAIESLDSSRPAGREGRLFDLVILSLYLHSAGSSHEMVAAFLEQAPTVTEALFVYPLVLDKKRDVLTTAPLEGIVEPHLERAMEAFQEDLASVELDLPVSHFRRLVIEGGEVAIRDSLAEFWGDAIPAETISAAEATLGIKKVALVPMLVEGEPYGLVAFAFGKEALTFATICYVTVSLMSMTIGVLAASLGHMDFKAAVLGLFKVPTLYAVALAASLNYFHFELPLPLSRTVDLAANASIPVMIVLLGLELSRFEWSHSLRPLSLSVILRLLVAPTVALLLVIPFGLQGAARQGNVIEASMPAAVMNTVLASEYGLDSSLVTAIVFVGTILSPLTLTPLLVYLGR